MNSPMNTDQEIEMQCMEAEQMIIEHDISQRKKKKKNKKNENLSFPIDEDEDLQEKMKKKNENPSFPIDEDEDLQEQTKEKGEIVEVEQPTFAMEERAMENHSSPANSSPPQPIVNTGPSSVEPIALPTTVPNLQHRKGHDLDSLKKIWNNIHVKNESKDAKQREQKILLTNATVANFHRDWYSALELQGYSYYDMESKTQKVFVNGSPQPKQSLTALQTGMVNIRMTS